MKKNVFLIVALAITIGIAVVSFLNYRKSNHCCDVTVMGSIMFNDGIGRQTIGLIDCLKDSRSIQYVKHGNFDWRYLPEGITKIVHQTFQRKANVLIFEEPLLYPNGPDFPSLPDSTIKIAYSMVESTKLPQNWTKILNSQFDAVIVPDQFLVDVYKNCGVRIPIFVVPIGMYLDPFLEINSLHAKPHDRPFIFGNLASYIPRKNQTVLIQSFAKVFGNDPHVRLVLNGRTGDKDYFKCVEKIKNDLGLDNVTITTHPLKWKNYIKTMNSFDCYVSPSKGEGFSLGPREALALALPTIVTDNTAQHTICSSGYVKVVPSSTPIAAHYQIFQDWHEDLGMQFECDVDALATALRDVYENYESHAAKAYEARKWVEQYRNDRLKKLYETIVLPKKVILSDRDAVEDGIIYTTSPELKQRYETVISKQTMLHKLLNSLVIAIQ